jgi:excisionase family DNA binding protein
MTIANERLEFLNGRDALIGAREDTFEPLLDSNEAAALLKIHPKTIQKMARNGEISAIHIGKLWRFRASALDEWVKRLAS